ncbi:hypothetical protein FHW36_11820 [Chitinophaga polysaccharea]|uniref:Uncharacterized protein n=2 Tax=Chitinophaga polysaccharea TaxID=1293035 RepID=A0A561P0S4_9BACT|nr:hypothetical protein FHW36_11820 [Chitinophaga polysaccharea]
MYFSIASFLLTCVYFSYDNYVRYVRLKKKAELDKLMVIARINASRDDIRPPGVFSQEIRYSGHEAISSDGRTLDRSKLSEMDKKKGIDIIMTYTDDKGTEISILKHWTPLMLGIGLPELIQKQKELMKRDSSTVIYNLK